MLRHWDTSWVVVCGKSWQASRIPPDLTFSHKPSLLSFLHSSISTLLCLFSLCSRFLFELKHTHTLYVHYFCYGIQWPGGSSEDRLDCCWPDIKKYLMSPHTHARTHLWSMRLSTASFRNKTCESHSHLYCFLSVISVQRIGLVLSTMWNIICLIKIQYLPSICVLSCPKNIWPNSCKRARFLTDNMIGISSAQP